MAKRFTLILVPDAGSRIKRYKIRSTMVFSILSVLAVLVGVLSFFTYNYFKVDFNRSEMTRLQVENSAQRQELKRLAVDFEGLRQELNALAESDARIRQLASLDGEDQDIPIAIGGLPEKNTETVDEVQRQINDLMVEVELRRQSQEGVRNLLNDQVSLSRATPQGWPTKGWITSYFGKRKSPFTGRRVMHEGLDIAANTGTPVVATADGVVTRANYDPSYGKMVVIEHGYGYRTIFGHNSKLLVKAGQRVKRGDQVAQVGNTGQSTGPHLHYELRMNGVPVDPRKTL